MKSRKQTQTASHWGVYNVETDRFGRIVGTTPFALDPNPSPIAAALPQVVRDPLRIDRPYVRESFLRSPQSPSGAKRGQERFVPVSWDSALDLVASTLGRVKSRYGNPSIYGGSYGWASAGRLHHSPSLVKRFLGLFGGYVDKLGNHSYGAALHIMPYVIGRTDIENLISAWPLTVESTRLVVMFGGAHFKNTQIDSGGVVQHEAQDWFARAKKARIEFVCISPSKSDAPQGVESRWVSLRPNTDVALMLGLAHTLAAEGLVDRKFVERYCVGYGRFERYLLGKDDNTPKDAQWASRITGVDAEHVRGLARRMADTRTLVLTSWSVQRADHGEQPIWMTVVLAAMLGQIGLPGGGFGFGLAAESGIGMPVPGDIPRPTIPLGPNPVKQRVPVGRVTDMLLHPGSTIDYNGSPLTFPDIKLTYSVGGNPFHHNTNLNRFLAGWQKPEAIIVHEPWWTPPAKFADIVLPATTTMERNDIQASALSRYYVAMHKVIEPVGASRNDYDIFADLAERLGFRQDFTEGRDEMGWLSHMYEQARAAAHKAGYDIPPFDEFWAEGICEFPVLQKPEPVLAEFRADPVAHALKTPSGRIEITSETIERFGYADCPAHPSWLEPVEWLGAEAASRFPIHLLSNQSSVRLHSQLDHSDVSRGAKMAGREVLTMNEADAQARGLVTGEVVRVFNSRGAFLAAVRVAQTIAPGVAQIATGAWYDPQEPGVPGSLEKHGNPNVVTIDKGTSRLAQSSTAQSVLVQIEKYTGNARVTAFDSPLGASAFDAFAQALVSPMR
jgi:biotin/methionine sulfoxide reductase